MGLSLESAGDGGAGIRGGDGESARLDWLRTEIYRGDQQRLGRKSLYRPDEWTRCGDRKIYLHRWRENLRGRRILRRIHDGLDGHAHEPLQMHHQPRGAV